MEQPRTFMYVAALALVAIALGQPAATGRDSDGSVKPDLAKSDRPAGDKGKTPPAPDASGASIDEPPRALEAVADSFGTSIAPSAMYERMIREARLARTLGAPDDRIGDAKRLLGVFVEIAAPKERPGIASLDGRSDRNLSASDYGRLCSLIEAYFKRPASPTKLAIAVLQEVARRQATRVRFLIATLPDPFDSYTGWQFDPMLAAIAEAINASDYIYDHANLPSANPAEGVTAVARQQLHESKSGALVFRKHRGKREDSESARELLVLLVVNENPAQGVHVPALIDAFGVVTRWQDQLSSPRCGRHDAVSILGPTYSGSSESIVRAIAGANRRQLLDAVGAIRIISGSATDDANRWTIGDALAMMPADQKPSITFTATVQPDKVVLKTLIRYMGSLGWTDRMALLYENNTQYGRSLHDAFGDDLDSSRLIQVPFSMNVSHLRDKTPDETLGVARALGLSPHFGRLAMDALPAPVDQIPQITPDKSSSYAELSLSSQMQTMRTERVGRVILMATDPRDKLYFSRQLMQSLPNVAMATVESDSIYYHPDYAYSTQGMLVASTYPLDIGTQRWSYGPAASTERHAFANGSAEGTYNAALLLLDYDANGHPAPA